MSVFISDAMSLGVYPDPIGANANSPRIGIENITNQSNIFESPTQLDSNPSWLTSTPSTSERWKTSPADYHFWYSSPSDAIVDFVGIAAHRGLIGRQIRILYTTTTGGGVIYGPVQITDSSPIFINFEEIEPVSIIVVFESTEDFSFEVGNIYVGKSVFLPRNIYVGHTPITFGRNVSRLIENSDNGNYLGNVRTKVSLGSSVNMSNIDQDYYRDEIFKQFQIPAEVRPFFWAWRPNDRPLETGFCWTNGDVRAVNDSPNGDMALSFSMTGFSSNE